MEIKDYIGDVINFPKEGIIFKDITPLLMSHTAMKEAISLMCRASLNTKIDYVVSSESRGFLFGVPMALTLDAGFIPVRKKGKLPRPTTSVTYSLEYGEDTLQMHYDIKPGDKIIIVDDVLATGGTIDAMIKMVESMGGEIVEIVCLIEIDGLGGREKLNKYPITTIIKY